MNLPQEDKYLDWSSQRRVLLPSGTADGYMLVPIRDFQRLRKGLSDDLKSAENNLPAAYYALFGAAIAVVVALPPLMTSSGLPSWIVPTFIVSTAAFLVLGTILAVISRALKTHSHETITKLADEMREIERTYLNEPVLRATSPSTARRTVRPGRCCHSHERCRQGPVPRRGRHRRDEPGAGHNGQLPELRHRAVRRS